ncbi:lipopolysaccharide assembly LapA domain-containing protein [Mycobacterium sp. 141]|uniref:LapA family protein n=1 Tax=Mycobacterium sp. 141 TaxID=1120797 RepID=UPI00037EBA91|nr:lipopolysaccharide assembly protein LapA domain-containing protein [Mycobacterium sp. 141]
MTSDLPASPDQPGPKPRPAAPKPDQPTSTPDAPKSQPPVSPKFTRAAALWSALIVGFLILIVLLIFIGQNTDPVPLRFLGWHWSLPTGVAILGAAVAGGLLTVAAGTARIFQLRRTAKKNLKAALSS